MSIFEHIKQMDVYEFAGFLSSFERYVAIGDYDSFYDDGKQLEDIIKSSVKCDERSKILKSLNKEFES